MYIKIFSTLSFAILSLLPIINLSSGVSIDKLYDIDMLETHFNKYAEKLGISTNPSQVIVGSNGWLYLGDAYSKTITQNRQASNSESLLLLSKKINRSQEIWSTWLSQQNVKDYKIIIGPDKDTIYPEYYPKWAQSKNGSPVRYLLSNKNIYVNVSDSLRKSKAFSTDLYYKTDTHWNNYGAGIAFETFITELNHSHPSIITPNDDWYDIDRIEKRNGGDLSRFLKVSHITDDIKPITLVSELNIKHLIYDYNKNKLVYKGNQSLFGNMHDLYLINTPNALNNKKVLWLSDSFGDALSPYMATTFNNVLKVHWDNLIGKKQFQQLVKLWKPDFVFVTTVERDALSQRFTVLPMPIVLAKNHILKHSISANIHTFNNIKQDKSSLSVNGRDPYITFNFKHPFTGKLNPYISFKLTCETIPSDIPIQIFWKSNNTSFNEYDSVKFNAKNGINTINIPHWADQEKITNLRIDLDGKVDCMNFTLTDVLAGR